jgi:nucleotide-binding universal stress UspA family protein
MELKNILVAVDGSATSDKALDFAVALSEKFGAALKLLNVSEALTVGVVSIEQAPSLGVGANLPVNSRDFRQIHEQILSKSLDRAKMNNPAVAISSVLREGDPALEIVSVAKEGGFDVVVVGHRGMGKVRELFVGSVAEKVVHLAPCPVVIVR